MLPRCQGDRRRLSARPTHRDAHARAQMSVERVSDVEGGPREKQPAGGRRAAARTATGLGTGALTWPGDPCLQG